MSSWRDDRTGRIDAAPARATGAADQAAQEPGQKQNSAPGPDETGGCREESFLGDWHGGLELPISGPHHVGVAVPHHQPNPAERTGLHHRLAMGFEPREPFHIGLRGRALAACEIIGIAA
jgi:hypothetical protein